MKIHSLLVVASISLAVFAGCSGCSSDQSVDPGTTETPTVDAAVDQEAAKDAASDQTTDAAPQGNGVTIVVSYQGQGATVDLGTVATSAYKGVNLVKLSDLWTATQIAADRNSLEFELVAADGFKPSDKGCPDLSGAVLDKGYIDPTSRNVTWDESLGFKGCYSVKGVGNINAHKPSAADAAAE